MPLECKIFMEKQWKNYLLSPRSSLSTRLSHFNQIHRVCNCEMLILWKGEQVTSKSLLFLFFLKSATREKLFQHNMQTMNNDISIFHWLLWIFANKFFSCITSVDKWNQLGCWAITTLDLQVKSHSP